MPAIIQSASTENAQKDRAMSSIIEEIKPETAEMIKAQAEALGLSVDEYLRELLPASNGDSLDQPLYKTASTEEWLSAFSEWATDHPTLPIMADDSRESIYQGRGE